MAVPCGRGVPLGVPLRIPVGVPDRVPSPNRELLTPATALRTCEVTVNGAHDMNVTFEAHGPGLGPD